MKFFTCIYSIKTFPNSRCSSVSLHEVVRRAIDCDEKSRGKLITPCETVPLIAFDMKEQHRLQQGEQTQTLFGHAK